MIRICVLLALAAACGKVGETNSGENDPTITSVSPDHGPAGGGITITVEGSGFSNGDTVVLIGGLLADATTVESDTRLSFVLPPGDENVTADVVVGNANGFGTKAAAFRYNPRPILLSITPEAGRSVGGTQVTITGRGFQTLEAGVPTVRIGGGLATDVQIIDDRTIVATTGPVNSEVKPFSKVDVEVENTNGVATITGGFTTTARGLLAFARFSSDIYFVDKLTGDATKLAVASHRVGGCTTRGGVLYGVGRSGGQGHSLVTIDALTGQTAVLGKLSSSPTTFHGTSSIAFVGTRLFAIDNANSGARTMRLMEINPSNGMVTLLPAINGPVENGSAIASRDATSVFYMDRANQTVDTINVTTGTLTPGATMNGNQSRIHGLASVDGTMYLLERDNSRISTVNPATGALTSLATLPFPANGMCETPSTF